jgi:hypothetical protein
MPDGAIRINPTVSMLKKEGRVTWFVGSDNFFSHPADDSAGVRLGLAALMDNGHARPSQIVATLGVARRNLMRWRLQLEQKGAASFYQLPAVRGGPILDTEKIAECVSLLAAGNTVASAARGAGIGESTLRKAVAAGRVPKVAPLSNSPLAVEPESSTKSGRSQQDAAAAEAMGTACTRASERTAAAIGLAGAAATRFEPATDVALGGVLCGLPTLCANGLFSGLDQHLSLPKGYYTALHVLCVLGFMALARIRRPEQLRHQPPGELGKTIGLDRIPEVRTLREKIAYMAKNGTPGKWALDLSRSWMQADPKEAGYLYVDGHVRVYHGADAVLPRRYVSRQRLCLRGTTDYWVNDALGRPFFVVSKAVSDGLACAIVEDILPELLDSVPGQPTEEQLAADPLLHRFVVVCDREGSHHSLLSRLWQDRVAAITYRKSVTDVWDQSEFTKTEVPSPGGGTTSMRLASRQTQIKSGLAAMPVLEVRRLNDSGHQTAIITTARTLENPAVAGRIFSRWCQENYFGYMMEHYDIDGLIQYGSEDIPGTTQVVNPAWRKLDKDYARLTRCLRKLQAELGAALSPSPKNPVKDTPQDPPTNAAQEGPCVERPATLLETLQQIAADRDKIRENRRNTPRKVAISELPEADRPSQLLPLAKTLTDAVKMIAYRAETALVGLLRPHLANEAEARALIRELFVSSADIQPDDASATLTVSVHRMASPVHDRAIACLLSDLTDANFRHPETGHRLIYRLV